MLLTGASDRARKPSVGRQPGPKVHCGPRRADDAQEIAGDEERQVAYAPPHDGRVEETGRAVRNTDTSESTSEAAPKAEEQERRWTLTTGGNELIVCMLYLS